MKHQRVPRETNKEDEHQNKLKMNEKYVLEHLRNIPDFPKQGIQYKDINYLFTNAGVLHELGDELKRRYKDKGITKVVGLETRGIVMGAITAEKLDAGLVMCRKKGKMPGITRGTSYAKEYGEDKIEIQAGAITNDDVVLIHDDLLATGGSMAAAYKLVESFHPKKIYINFLFELRSEGLKGREALPKNVDADVLITLH